MTGEKENQEDDWIDCSILIGIAIGIIIIVSLLMSLIRLLPPVIAGSASLNEYASFASAGATILLVLLTGRYVILTENLVEQTRKSRKEEAERAQSERERRKRKLRLAIKKEIETGGMMLEDGPLTPTLGNNNLLDQSPYDLMPTTVYDNNAGNIGTLSSPEVGFIVAYYSVLEVLSALYQPDMAEFMVPRTEVRELLEENFSDINQLSDTDLIEEVVQQLPFNENGEVAFTSLFNFLIGFFRGLATNEIDNHL